MLIRLYCLLEDRNTDVNIGREMSKSAQRYEYILNNLKVKRIEIDSGLIQAIGNRIIGLIIRICMCRCKRWRFIVLTNDFISYVLFLAIALSVCLGEFFFFTYEDEHES